MTRAQVEDLVDRRKASGSLVESLEVEGYARAADWVYREAAAHTGVPAPVVSEVHRAAMHLAWEIEAPALRPVPGQDERADQGRSTRLRRRRHRGRPTKPPSRPVQSWSTSPALGHGAGRHAFETLTAT